MDITKFIVSRREKALLVGDHGSYRKQLSRRLLIVRKKLHHTSQKGKKYAPKAPVTAEDVGSNHEYAHLLLLTSERAWAQAMHIRYSHGADSGDQLITGSTKTHIISRLQKASNCAGHLVELLRDQRASKASSEAILEARAYYQLLRGGLQFEKRSWQECLRDYSEAKLIYTSATGSKDSQQHDLFQDLLTSTIDPSMQFAAYQLKVPRTTSLEAILKEYIARDGNEYIDEVIKRDSGALDDQIASKKKSETGDLTDVPKTIQWRTRKVKLEDAAVAQALRAVASAEKKLASFLSENPDATPQAKAAAFDEVLIPSQDAVDATKTAIDELSADGVPQSDHRMQSLQITRTAVTYTLVGWRVGRNRVLSGVQDGAVLQAMKPKPPGKSKGAGPTSGTSTKPEESNNHIFKRLRENIVLYDATLQSLDTVKMLPGVAADQNFVTEIDGKRWYFRALRCLAVARAHGIMENTRDALALISQAAEHSSKASSDSVSEDDLHRRPPDLTVTTAQISGLQQLSKTLLLEYRALVELTRFPESAAQPSSIYEGPLVGRLEDYPSKHVDLSKLVTYPPNVEPIPVKPMFLDVAYNYIEYPGRSKHSPETRKAVNGATESADRKESKKGWFGFGR